MWCDVIRCERIAAFVNRDPLHEDNHRTFTRAFTLLAVAAAAQFAHAAEDIKWRWKLDNMYATQADWDKDAKALEAQFKTLSGCSGQLTQSTARLKACLDLRTDATKRFYKLASYAFQSNDQDTGDTAGLDLKQRADVLQNRLQETTSFFAPEFLKAGRTKVESLMKKDKSLAIYQHGMDDLWRTAAHTLDKKGEELIATFGNATGTADAVYSTLSNSDMPWPKVKLSDGSEVLIDQSAYTKYRALPNRADRKLVFDAFWGKWKEFERTYGVTFYEMLKKDAAYAKVRNYPDSLAQSLDGNKLPKGVYDALISAVNANLPTLHRYFKLRAKMLGVTDMGLPRHLPAPGLQRPEVPLRAQHCLHLGLGQTTGR